MTNFQRIILFGAVLLSLSVPSFDFFCQPFSVSHSFPFESRLFVFLFVLLIRRRAALWQGIFLPLTHIAIMGFFFAWGAFVFRVLINSIAYKFWHRTFATSICLCTMYLRARSFFYYLSSFCLLRFFSITIAIPSPNQSHSVLSIWEFHVHISFYMGMEYVFMYCVCTWRMNFSCSFRLGLFFCGFPHPLSFRWQQPFNIKLIANVDFQQLLENIFGL